MKTAVQVLTILTLFGFSHLYSQQVIESQIEDRITEQKPPGAIAKEVARRKEQFLIATKESVFKTVHSQITRRDLRQSIPTAILLEPDFEKISPSLRNKPEVLLLELPFADNQTITLELYAQNPYSKDFKLKTSDGRILNAPNQIHYRGIVKGHPGSLAGISISGNEISGIISTLANGSWVLGRVEDEETLHVLFPGDDIPDMPEFECHTPDSNVEILPEDLEPTNSRDLTDCIGLYLEVDHNMYLNRMSNVNNVNTWINSVFNNVSILYANEQINIQINEVFVWTTPDSYSNNTSTALTQFGNANPTFDGNLAHLIQFANGILAGIAWVDVLCNPFPNQLVEYGVSRVSSSFQNFPTYNWTVQVLTHELGHNIGSPHTHSCSWPGGAIDNCVPVEGSCSPGPSPGPGGGTIMSYCHLTSPPGNPGNPGINFANGFGTLPGNLIRNRVTNANCLFECGAGDPCSGLNTSVTPSGTSCGQSNGSISISASGGTSPYTTSIGGSFSSQTVYNNLSSGNYTVTVRDANSCETSSNVVVAASSGINLNLSIQATTCALNNGSIQVFASGGQAPYQYNIGFGSTSNNIFSNLGSGSYTLTVTSNNGCSATANAFISSSNAISAFATAQPTTCGANNGSISATPSGGGTPYLYDIGNGPGGSSNFNNLAAGTYTVTVTNVNLCTATASATVTGSTAITMTSTISHTTCNLNNGSITINTSNTTGAVQYSVNGNTQSTNIFNNLSSGNYNVSVTDAAGCTKTNISVVNASTALNISTQTTNANCGLNQGTITVNVSSGTAPYLYNFGTGNQGSNTKTNLAAGTYTITVTDASSCTKTAQAVIQSTPAVSFTVQTTPAFCGSNNGTISINAVGGNGNFTYSIGGSFVSTSTFSSLQANNYAVTVQDGNGCSSTQSIVVGTISNLNASISVTSTITCPGGNNGALQVSTTGGSPTFNYVWSNNQTSASISNLIAATYTVTVTDALGCQKTATQIITQPAAFSINPTTNPASCFGASTGSITVNVSGATPPYQYSLNGGNFQSSNQFSNLSAATYSVTVRDASQCTSSASVVVSQNTAISANTQATNVLCFGQSNGSIIVNASGGVSPYQYAINSGNFQGSNSFSGLPASSYQITVKDANNCTLNISQIITQPAAISATASTQPVTCFGQSNGSITINASGGTAPLQFNLNGGTFQNQNSFINLVAGNYNIIVKDANNCQFPLSVIISQPTAILVSAQSSPSTCSNSQNGSITLVASGGNGPYQYSINGGTPNSNGVFTGLAAGTYSYLVTGTSQCSASGNVTVASPPVLNMQLSGNPVSCSGGNNGVITVSASGGTAPYQYSINGGNFGGSASFTGLTAGTYNLQIKDNNDCLVSNTYTVTQPGSISLSANATNVSCFGLSNGSATAQAQGGTSGFMYSWSNGAAGSVINNIPAGTYSVTATDSNGCTSTASVAVIQPAALIINVQSSPLGSLGASDGTATATASGGTGTYNYQWSNGQTTSLIQNLPAGSYNVTVTDANNCTATGSVIIAPFNCNLSATAQNIVGVSCFGLQNGGATIAPSNGQSPYSFLWPGAQTTATVNNLAAGNYAITVADAASCQAIVNLTITQPQQVEIALAATDVSCFGGNNGTLNALGSGGTAPYTYSINATDFQTSGLFSGLVAGNYSITIKDANQCVRTFNGVVGSPTALAIQLQADTILCHGASTGNAVSTVTGGLGPYTYLWSNGTQAANLQGVPSNSYGLTVTDSKGCTITSSVSITQNDSLYLEIQITQPTAEILNNGRIEINPQGGTGPYSVLWNNQSTEKILNDLMPGTYQVIITDANGCTLISNIVLTDPTCALTVVLIDSSQITCHGGSDGSIEIQVEGTSLPYEIMWSNGMQTSGVEGLIAGIYFITVEDERGCTDTLSIELTQPDPLALEPIEGPDETVTQNEVIYNTNLLPGMTYEWSCSNGQISPGPQPNEITVIWLQAGEQTVGVRVTDANGCTAIQILEVFVGTNSTNFDEIISGIKVFPNPFSEGIWIQSEALLSKPVSIILMDLHGKVLRSGSLWRQLEWNLDNLPSGIYVLKAEEKFFKIVKQ
jgi:hypothetical protein